MTGQYLGYCILICVLFLAIVMASCVADIDTDPKNLIGRWQMVKVVRKGEIITKPDSKDWLYDEVEIEFSNNGTIEGTLSYDTFTGDYKTVGEDSITIYCQAYTKRGDSDWGYLFYNNIRAIKTFELRKSVINFKYKELRLNYEDGELIFDRRK